MAKDTEMQEELKRIREQEEANKTAAYRTKVMNDRLANRAAEMDEARAKQFRPGKKGEKVPIWDDAMHQAEQAINKETTTVNDWRNAMLSLIQMFSTLVKAMDASLSVSVRQPLKGVLVDQFLLGVVYDKGLKGAVNGVRHLVCGDKPIDLPSLAHNVTFTDDNKLNIDKLVRSDNAGEMGKLDQLFEKGVYKWLEDEGYTPDPADKTKLLDAHGRQLTKDDFDDMKDRFTEFLSESSDLTFTARP
ncbi:hypothetical protein [Legionella maioricensis]|uniref:Membrane-associated HD superfamily hydrolase n=1 Tax=Legionella maioricensis TaxID=2896528 RepID=A0A9X2IDQ7_9GAMM|nr:hypothetical protein [Legionella maioricensis]MCL9685028.1 hypothetical protein [Legionella maioricensis]MCL9688075.1 hypothetical protein [Legionella maioricensis]